MGDLNRIEKHVLDLPLDVKAEGEPGVFEGYGAIFGNLDRDGDIVAKGAFAASLQGRVPALLWQHNAKEPIGKFDEVREDEKGLYVRGRLSLQGRGGEAYELLKMGALDGLSIGFITKEASKDALTGARTIKRAELMEISLVTFPANELARVSAVKAQGSVPETKEAFIRMLTDHGMTADRATTIARGGFQRACNDELSSMVRYVKERQTAFEVKRSSVIKESFDPGETRTIGFEVPYEATYRLEVWGGLRSTEKAEANSRDLKIDVFYYKPDGRRKTQVIRDYRAGKRFTLGSDPTPYIPGFLAQDPVMVKVKNTSHLPGRFNFQLV